MGARAAGCSFPTGSVGINGYRINGLEPIGADAIDSVEEKVAVLGLPRSEVVGVVSVVRVAGMVGMVGVAGVAGVASVMTLLW